MPVEYNLRSIAKKKASARNCYLQTTAENLNPSVRLERLKLLECHNSESSRFYLDNGRIIPVNSNKLTSSKKKGFFKIICTFVLFLLIMSLIYWRDYLQCNGITLLKKYGYTHPSVQHYYSQAVQLHNIILKQFKYKQPSLSSENAKSVSFQGSKRNLTSEITDDFEIRQLVKDYFDEINGKKIQNLVKSPQSFIEEQCRRDVKNYSNLKKKKFSNVTFHDLANLTDYALESQGAKIVSVFDTELYGTVSVKYLNINFWPKLTHFFMKNLKCFSSVGPNSVLIPWKKPGDCWAFKGSKGRVQIELVEEIYITAVTVEHISKEISPEGNINSAPKKFSLFGIKESGSQTKRINLGSYEYDKAGPSMQTFLLNFKMEMPFRVVEVLIESNHGNENFTCIYKIRIHGHK